MHDLSKVRRVLIINLKYIGDVLLSTPVIEAIKKERKNISIAMLVNEGTETTLYNNPDLDEIFVINSRWRWGRQLKLIRTIRSCFFVFLFLRRGGGPAAVLGRFLGLKKSI
jgi:heptosyltransferase-3